MALRDPKRPQMPGVATPPAERRQAPRREMAVLCTTSFLLNGRERRAILLDLSSGGAQFGIAAAVGAPSFVPDQVLSFYLYTPFGAATLEGRVVWSASDEVLYRWGVAFTRPPALDRDPMKCLLAS
jgi:hypothetical protein